MNATEFAWLQTAVGHLPAADLDQVKEQHQIRIVLPRRTGSRFRKGHSHPIRFAQTSTASRADGGLHEVSLDPHGDDDVRKSEGQGKLRSWACGFGLARLRHATSISATSHLEFYVGSGTWNRVRLLT